MQPPFRQFISSNIILFPPKLYVFIIFKFYKFISIVISDVNLILAIHRHSNSDI